MAKVKTIDEKRFEALAGKTDTVGGGDFLPQIDMRDKPGSWVAATLLGWKSVQMGEGETEREAWLINLKLAEFAGVESTVDGDKLEKGGEYSMFCGGVLRARLLPLLKSTEKPAPNATLLIRYDGDSKMKKGPWAGHKVHLYTVRGSNLPAGVSLDEKPE